MSKRQIEAAAKRAGMQILDAWYGWHPEPGEMVPGWDITFTDETEDRFDIDGQQFFANTTEAIEWIEEQQPKDPTNEQ